jgi:hypothetical protein
MVSGSISHQLQRQSILVVEATIPPDVTIADWCRRRPVEGSRLSRAAARFRRIRRR